MSPLVLASASLRRAELLREAGFDFEIAAADVDETPHAEETGAELVLRLAQSKARTCQKSHAQAVIVAADTVVVCDGVVHGKPRGRDDYMATMHKLSGRAHEVMSGVCVLSDDQEQVFHCVTQVTFKILPEVWLAAYWESGEPAACAGGYAIQGLAGHQVQNIQGSYDNVVGLPVHETCAVLSDFGVRSVTGGASADAMPGNSP